MYISDLIQCLVSALLLLGLAVVQAADVNEETCARSLPQVQKGRAPILRFTGVLPPVGGKYHGRDICGMDDTRQLVFPRTTAEFATCCLLIKFPGLKTNVQGTGFIVAKNFVLTAGHCVYDPNYGGWADLIEAIPGANGPKIRPFGTFSGATVFTVRGWKEKRDRNYDYGGIALLPGIHSVNVPDPITLHPLTDDEFSKVICMLLGYPADKAPQTQWKSVPAEKPSEVEPLVIHHSLDATGGNSGGPLLLGLDSSQAVAVHTRGGCASFLKNSGTRITEFRTNKILGEWAR